MTSSTYMAHWFSDASWFFLLGYSWDLSVKVLSDPGHIKVEGLSEDNWLGPVGLIQPFYIHRISFPHVFVLLMAVLMNG